MVLSALAGSKGQGLGVTAGGQAAKVGRWGSTAGAWYRLHWLAEGIVTSIPAVTRPGCTRLRVVASECRGDLGHTGKAAAKQAVHRMFKMKATEERVHCLDCRPASSVQQRLQASWPTGPAAQGCAVQNSPARLW